MNTLLLVIATAISLLLAGCGKPPYWVRGLSLPPGATVVTRKQTTDDGRPALHVAFDTTLDWPALGQHFDQCLSGGGYQETADTNLFGQTGRQPDYRYYTSPGRKVSVILHDHQTSRNQMAQVGLGRRDGPGRYELTVLAGR